MAKLTDNFEFAYGNSAIEDNCYSFRYFPIVTLLHQQLTPDGILKQKEDFVKLQQPRFTKDLTVKRDKQNMPFQCKFGIVTTITVNSMN